MKNFKTSNRWKDIHVHGSEDLILRWQTNIDSMQSPSITADFFAEIDKLILKFTWKFTELRLGKAILEKGGLALLDSDFKTYYKVH